MYLRFFKIYSIIIPPTMIIAASLYMSLFILKCRIWKKLKIPEIISGLRPHYLFVMGRDKIGRFLYYFLCETKKKRMQVAHVVGMLQGINLKYAFVVADLEIILCYLHLDWSRYRSVICYINCAEVLERRYFKLDWYENGKPCTYFHFSESIRLKTEVHQKFKCTKSFFISS